MKISVRAECSPEFDALDERRRGRQREQLGQEVAELRERRARRGRALDPDVDVQAERVVAPDDVAQDLVVAAVVRRVDDPLVLPVSTTGACPWPRARSRASRRARRAARGARPSGSRLRPRLAAAGAHLDLGRDQLADEMRLERRAARGRLQLLEAVHELERLGVEDRELLLHGEGEVASVLERLARTTEMSSSYGSRCSSPMGRTTVVEVEVNPRAGRAARATSKVARVCIIGAESTGKTTLAAALADHYGRCGCRSTARLPPRRAAAIRTDRGRRTSSRTSRGSATGSRSSSPATRTRALLRHGHVRDRGLPRGLPGHAEPGARARRALGTRSTSSATSTRRSTATSSALAARTRG